MGISPHLKKEGFAREFINRIQAIRKERRFELTDKIVLIIEEKDTVKDIITEFNEYICAEILADQLEMVPELAEGTEVEVNDIPVKVFVSKKA